MKKAVIIFFFFVVVFGIIYLNREQNIMTYKFDGKAYRLYVADDPIEWQKGLMNYRKLDKGIDGMIFLFPDKKYRTFWNKNTYLNLRLIWLDDDRRVSESYLPSIDTSKSTVMVNSLSPVNKVIELNVR